MKIIAWLLVLFLSFSLPPSVRAGSVFTVGEPHASTLEFRQFFETMSASFGSGTLSIAQNIYVAEDADALWQTVMADWTALCGVTGLPPEDLTPHTVYVVRSTPNGLERIGRSVYCTAKDIESGRYLAQLACAALGTEEYWKGAGLAGLISGRSADIPALKAAYRQMDDLDPLSLFIAYFTAPFASEADIRLAEDTALALCAYVLENHGIKALRSGDCITARAEWLQSIGVDRPYADPYYETLTGYRFSPNTSYPLVAVNPYGHRIYLAQMEDMQSAKDLRMFLYDMLAGPQAVLALVAAESPAHLEAVKARYEGRMWVYCGSTDGSYTYVEGRNIYLQLSYGYLHELGHILFPTPRGANFYSQMWQYEGLCDYLSYTVYPTYARAKSYFGALYFYAGLDQIEDKTPNQRFYVKLFDLYLRHAPMPKAYEEVDAALFNECMAAVPLVFPDAAPDSDWVHPVSDIYPALHAIAGNELTYQQSYAFAAWLIREHSLKTYLGFCLEGLAFDAAFGMPYEGAKAAWLEAFLPAFQ